MLPTQHRPAGAAFALPLIPTLLHSLALAPVVGHALSPWSNKLNLNPAVILPNYRFVRPAGDPVPTSSGAQNPLPLALPTIAPTAPLPVTVVVSVRPVSGSPSARFYITLASVTDPATVRDHAELTARPDGTFAFGITDHDAGVARGTGLTLWALGSDGRVIARLPIAVATQTVGFGADGQFHAAGLPSWVAPVAVIGGVAIVGVIAAGFVLSEKA